MDLQPYATSFYDVVDKHFNASLIMIECKEIVAFKLEYLDTLATPSINFESKDIQNLFEYLGTFTTPSQIKTLTEINKNPRSFEAIELILNFPFMWGIKVNDPFLWNAEAGCADAKSILNRIGCFEKK